MPNQNQSTPTAVLVHAAWFDGSSWNKVTTELRSQGFQAVTAQIPLTSFTDDVAALRRLLRKQTGPLVVVGHSYGGAVATAAAAGDPKVKDLVYVAAIVPDQGETVGEIFQREAPHPKAPLLQPDDEGFLWLDVEAFREAVAPDASSDETALMAANQKPISVKCLGEAMTQPAWRDKPSWFLVAEKDRMVSPVTQQFTAKRMEARVVSAAADHVPLASAPSLVSQLIRKAAQVAAAPNS